ncbi:MAG: NADH-quinone oxidoreductase subunit K [Thiobacillus sp.]|nr:NADH-quinone oxidoreductase subunit K [Thiobacillus sp.]
MSLILMLAISIAVAVGVLLVLSRDVFRLIVGLAVLGSATNLIVFAAARPGGLIPAVIEAGATQLPAAAANPLPQALVLTAIVIGFALLCFALVLGAYLARQGGQQNVDRLTAAEPAATDPVKPPVLEQ